MPHPVLNRVHFDARAGPLRDALLREASYRTSPGDAEDIVQSTALCAWASVEQFDADGDQGHFCAWLMGILKNECRNLLLRRSSHPETLLAPDTLSSILPNRTGPDLDTSEASRLALFALLSRLTLKGVEEVSVRLWLDGETQAAIAVHLSITQQAVSWHIHAVKVKLAGLRAHARESFDGRHWFDVASEAVHYEKPAGVWDRTGNSEQIERRRREGLRSELRWMTEEIQADEESP
jgi:RNA polymerase sigma factor (sigma-70 family)